MDLYSEAGKGSTASLYFVDHQMIFVKIIDRRFDIPNGLAWDDAHSRCYHVDSISKAITAYDYNIETGMLTQPKVVIQFDGKEGVPDGMTIDQAGHLWIAHWGGGKLSHWDCWVHNDGLDTLTDAFFCPNRV